MRVAIYSRVSTPKQSDSAQVQALKRYAAGRPAWQVIGLYRDVYSGASDRRPGLTRLLNDAQRKHFDVVLVWKFDRFARSVRQLVTAADTFKTLGIDFVSAQEAIDTTTPYGKLTFVLLAAVGEIERSFINERAALGRARALASGKHCGRPRSVFDRGKAAELRKQGFSWRELGIRFGRSKDTIRREVLKLSPAL